MPRPLRIEYENAWYHVMNRGAGRRPIFKTAQHRYCFLELLEEVTETFQAEIHAFCLMSNHYHLLVKTPNANLSQIMRHLNGVYTQRFNRTIQSDGPLFRGRYKALLIEADSYLAQVSRYIHLNPVIAKITDKPDDYPWSSYRAYFNKSKELHWLHCQDVLNQMNSKRAKQEYRNFCGMGIDGEIRSFYSKKCLPTILGGDRFREKALQQLEPVKIVESLHDIRRTRKTYSINQILDKVAAFYQITKTDLVRSKAGSYNQPRLLAMSICRRKAGHPLKEIAKHFGKITERSVSVIVGRVKQDMKNDLKLRDKYSELSKFVFT